MNYLKSRASQLFSWMLALLLPLLVVQAALANPIEEHAFDAAAFHIYRAVVFSDARADGAFYPRWVSSINGGLGGPLFSFYSPLAYFLMDGLHGLGISHPVAWRLLVAASLCVASAGMFGLGLALFDRADIALMAAACFTCAPYLLREFFEKGAPQGMAIALYPWLLWALLRLAERSSGLRLAAVAVCWAAIVLMHNLSAILLIPVLGVFFVYLAFRFGIRSLAAPMAAVLVGLLLSAFHVLPFAVDASYVQLEQASADPSAQPASSPVPLADVLAPTVILDTGLDNNATGYGVGVLQALALPLGIIISIALWRQKRIAEAVLAAGSSVVGLAVIVMQSDLATPIWTAISALSILQFRTRLLNLVGLAAAIALGYSLAQLPPRFRWFRGPLVFLLIVGFVGLALPMLYPQLLHRYAVFSPSPTVAEGQAAALKNHVPGFTLTTTRELLPRWRQAIFTDDEVRAIAATPIANLPDGAKIVAFEKYAERWRVTLETPVAFSAVLHLLYFPGWTATVNGTDQPLRPMENTGYTVIDLPAGRTAVDLRYEGTPAQHAGDVLSLAAILILVAVSTVWRGKGSSRLDAVYLQSHWLLVAGLVLLVGVKVYWLDPNTTFLRRASTCQAIADPVVQTDVWFGDHVHLCGYGLSQTVLGHDDSLRITLYWEIKQTSDEEVYSFVHLLGTAFNPDTNNPLWGQQDKQEPGEFPITAWQPGKLYRDVYEFRVPGHTPSGEYQLEIGWYHPTGERLKPYIVAADVKVSVSPLNALLIDGIRIR
jgi:6-pyruvoyl-tetrahydropterin synthase related domain